MLSRIKKLFSNHPEPINTVNISKKAIISNLKALQKYRPEYEIFPVLKSNAYGHGLKEVASILNKTSIQYICVDSYPEYQIVRDATDKKILLIGETLYKNYRHFDIKRTTFCIYNTKALEQVGKLSKKCKKRNTLKIHLFLNTGMNREGIQHNQLDEILEIVKKYPKLEIEGILSHFYDADNLDSQGYKDQISDFKEMCYTIESKGYSPKYRHISNTAGYIRNDDTFFNSARIGLGLYGYLPFAGKPIIEGDDEQTNETNKKIQEMTHKLSPALHISSRIISIQTIHKNGGVSYNHNFINTDEALQAGTVPFGYMEGLPKDASGKIYFKHKKTEIRQIGDICMNLSSCMITPKTKLYDEIEIIGIKGKNTIEKLAQKADKSIYETLVKIDKNIRRKII